MQTKDKKSIMYLSLEDCSLLTLSGFVITSGDVFNKLKIRIYKVYFYASSLNNPHWLITVSIFATVAENTKVNHA